METLQTMIGLPQEQNKVNLSVLARQQTEALQQIVAHARSANHNTDTRGIARPVNFTGEEHRHSV